MIEPAVSRISTRIDAATERERGDHPKVGRDSTAIVGDRDSVWVALRQRRGC